MLFPGKQNDMKWLKVPHWLMDWEISPDRDGGYSCAVGRQITGEPGKGSESTQSMPRCRRRKSTCQRSGCGW